MSLTNKTITSTAWSTGGLFVGQGLNLLRLAVLARLLTPEDFGVYAMVMVFYMFLTNAGDLGSSAVIVQRRELTRSLLGTVFWLNVGFGALLGLVCVRPRPRGRRALRGAQGGHAARVDGRCCSRSRRSATCTRRSLRRELRFKRLTGRRSRGQRDLPRSPPSTSPGAASATSPSACRCDLPRADLHVAAVAGDALPPGDGVFDRDDFRSILGFSVNLTAFNFVDYAAVKRGTSSSSASSSEAPRSAPTTSASGWC